MVSNPEANPGPLYRHGPAPGTFSQSNRNHAGLNINRDKILPRGFIDIFGVIDAFF
jgi:hypothetical protein